MYVNGNKNDGGNDHISLYARIEETNSLPLGWEVNVDLKLFVHNGKLHKYLTVTGTLKCVDFNNNSSHCYFYLAFVDFKH